ncbi:MAG: hypothetical protein Q8S34_15895 [Hydrogenophaga sp.]|nr:hypothetical protein [Hydrogenophaga sp.]
MKLSLPTTLPKNKSPLCKKLTIHPATINSHIAIALLADQLLNQTAHDSLKNTKPVDKSPHIKFLQAADIQQETP